MAPRPRDVRTPARAHRQRDPAPAVVLPPPRTDVDPLLVTPRLPYLPDGPEHDPVLAVAGDPDRGSPNPHTGRHRHGYGHAGP